MISSRFIPSHLIFYSACFGRFRSMFKIAISFCMISIHILDSAFSQCIFIFCFRARWFTLINRFTSIFPLANVLLTTSLIPHTSNCVSFEVSVCCFTYVDVLNSLVTRRKFWCVYLGFSDDGLSLEVQPESSQCFFHFLGVHHLFSLDDFRLFSYAL